MISIFSQEQKNKQLLRKRYRETRTNIIDKKDKSNIIFHQVILNEFYQNAKTVAVYKNNKEEVDTNRIIAYALNDGKKVVVPRVCDENDLKFYQIKTDEVFEISKFGIEEPYEDENKLVNIQDIDVMIIPGICFDNNCNRIGYGKGYYDKYLKNNHILKIGICFEEQILNDLINVDITDVPMDLVITEKRIIYK